MLYPYHASRWEVDSAWNGRIQARTIQPPTHEMRKRKAGNTGTRERLASVTNGYLSPRHPRTESAATASWQEGRVVRVHEWQEMASRTGSPSFEGRTLQVVYPSERL